jgi:hypothetical protein
MPVPTINELNELRKLPHSWEPSQPPAGVAARYISWRIGKYSEIQQRARLLDLAVGAVDRTLRQSLQVDKRSESPKHFDREEQVQKNQAAIALLKSWRDASEEDAQDQRETLEILKDAFGENF